MPSKVQYVVCSGRAVVLPDKTILRQNLPIPEDIPAKLIKEWVDSGFARARGAQPVTGPAPAVVTADGDLKEAKPTVQQKGKFNHDPDTIKNKTLDELNLMLADLDTAPAETVKEAVGLLSSDYKA